MNAVATIEAPSVIGSMAERFGMDKRAFEATLRGTIMPQNTSNEQCAAFLLVAKQHGLNPFTKEIFAFPSNGGIQPVVSVDGWMKLINSHPDFDGMEFVDTLDSSGTLTAVTCKMFRKDRSHPVSVTEYMSECRRQTPTWKQWPARMLRHKATIQAARYCFGFAGIMEPDEYERMHASEQAGAEATITVQDERKARHDEAAEQYAESIETIKERIAKWDADEDPDHLYTAAETWAGIPQAAQMDLWLAPTKGGIFTTHERDVIKSKLPKD
jgi:phage recombination protein Bet